MVLSAAPKETVREPVAGDVVLDHRPVTLYLLVLLSTARPGRPLAERVAEIAVEHSDVVRTALLCDQDVDWRRTGIAFNRSEVQAQRGQTIDARVGEGFRSHRRLSLLRAFLLML